MGTDWFRRTTWTPADVSDFQARLKRARGDAGKAQYLRIQALHLAGAGEHPAALGLLDQLIRDHPVSIQLAQAHLQRAESLIALGRDNEAVASFRACLAAEQAQPNVGTQGALEFVWFIATRRMNDLYDEAVALVEGHASRKGLTWPIDRYRAAAVRALIAAERGIADAARTFALAALVAAGETHSGFRHHPTVGLVRGPDPGVNARLKQLARPA